MDDQTKLWLPASFGRRQLILGAGAAAFLAACEELSRAAIARGGTVELTDSDGVPVETRRKTIALCRCGESGIKPLCDGTHKRIGFTAPGRDGRVAGGCELVAPSEE